MAHSAVVIGAGIAGLSAGIALKRAGYAVTVLEQAERIEPMGAALSIWGNAMAGLDWMGCGNAVRGQAARIDQLALRDLRERPLFGPVDIADTDSYLCLRRHLQTTLIGALGPDCLKLGVRVDAVSDDAGGVTVRSGGHDCARADLLVAADGIHSAIATDILGTRPVYAGYGGVLGLSDSPPTERNLAEELWGEGDRFGVFDHGAGTYWFYMTNGTESEVTGLTLAEIEQRARRYPVRVSDQVAATSPDKLIPVALHARGLPKRFGRGRIVCIGDAAHAMEPNQGQGACQGIEDAWALGVLAQRLGPDTILPAFEKVRRRRIARAHRDSAALGKVIHGAPLVREAVSAVFRTVPKTVDAMQIRRRIAPPDYA